MVPLMELSDSICFSISVSLDSRESFLSSMFESFVSIFTSSECKEAIVISWSSTPPYITEWLSASIFDVSLSVILDIQDIDIQETVTNQSRRDETPYTRHTTQVVWIVAYRWVELTISVTDRSQQIFKIKLLFLRVVNPRTHRLMVRNDIINL